MQEQWRRIPGFPEYEVSDQGRVRSWRARSRSIPHVLSPSATDRGYLGVSLFKPGDRQVHRKLVHRLVALAFLPNPHGLSDVAHNNGQPSDCRLSNLRWATHQDNQLDMRRHGTMQDGERCCTAKLTRWQAQRVRRECATGPRGTQARLARALGISPAQINRIAKGRRWRCLENAA
jgi:hypothetical protein